VKLNNISKFSFYLTLKKRLHYQDQAIEVTKETSHCVSYWITHTHIMWAKCRVGL